MVLFVTSGRVYRSANAASGDSGLVAAEPLDQPLVETTSSAPLPPERMPASPNVAHDAGGSAAGNSAVMAVGSLVSRGTGFLRTLVITAALGSAVGDAYTTAQIFPGMIYEFLIGGVLTSVLVPVLVRRRKSDPDGGEAYTQRLLSLAVLALGVATVLAVLAAPLLTALYAGAGTSGDTSHLITALAWLILPMIFFTGLSALLSAVLNTRGHFAAPMWTPILNNIVVIAAFGVFIVLFGANAGRGAADVTPAMILLIGGGTLLGMVVQAVGLAPALRKVGFRYRWRGQWRELGLRELGRLGGWMFCYVAVSQLGLIVLFNLAMTASDRKGPGPLIYNNVFLLVMMAHGIVAVSIITALVPRMSAAAADARWDDFTDDVSRGTRTIAAILAPIAVCYAVLATPVAVTLFRYGAFTAQNARDTGLVLFVGAAALVPFAVSQLFTFAFYALPDTKTPALVNIPVVALRVAVQVGLFAVLTASTVAAGLMVGNAVSYVAAAVVFAVLLRRQIGPLGARRILTTLGKVLLAAAGSGVVGYLVLLVLPGDDSTDRLTAITELVLGGAAIALSYLAFAMLLKIREINDVVALVRRRLGR
jgi:putative peptidoglycan lipid II flippase